MGNNIRWGLDNPHPFSKMKTELLWEGKYDEYGNRRGMVTKFCRYWRQNWSQNLAMDLTQEIY